MADIEHIKDFLIDMVEDLRARGIPDSVSRPMLERAVRKHCDLLCAPSAGGLGQFAESEELRQVRETISPWLWIASIAGFAMTVLNSHRIARMYKTWKDKRGRVAS